MLKHVRILPQPFSGHRVEVDLHEVETESGKRFNYEVARVKKNAVAVLPILDDGSVVLVKQQRLPVEMAYGHGQLLEVPAGLLESPDENREDRVRAELREEAGYEAKLVQPVGKFYTSPGFTNERVYLYTASGLTPCARDLEDAELGMTVEVIKKDVIVDLVFSNIIEDIKTAYLLMQYMAAKGVFKELAKG